MTDTRDKTVFPCASASSQVSLRQASWYATVPGLTSKLSQLEVDLQTLESDKANGLIFDLFSSRELEIVACEDYG